MRLNKLLSNIDILAPDISLNVRGSSSLKTALGGILSLFFVAVLAWLVVIIVQDFFDKTAPKIRQQVSDSDLFPKIGLVENKLVPVIVAYKDGLTGLLAEETKSYFTAKLMMYEYRRKSGTTRDDFDVIKKQFDYVACKSLSKELRARLFAGFGNYFTNEAILNTALCLDLTTVDSDIFVYGKSDSEGFSLCTIQLSPCSEGGSCASQEEVISVMVNPIYPEPIIDLRNYEHPLRYITNSDNVFYLNPGSIQFHQQKMMYSTIENDRGFLFGESRVTSYYHVEKELIVSQFRPLNQIECNPSLIGTAECKPYIITEIMSGGKSLVQVREYKGVVETLGEIGGVKELVYICFFYLYTFYHDRAAKHSMVREVYRAKRGSSKDKKVNPLNDPEQLVAQVIKGEELQVNQKTINKAFGQIENCLDIYNLIALANELKFLNSILFKDHHRKIIPVLTLTNKNFPGTPKNKPPPAQQLFAEQEDSKPKEAVASASRLGDMSLENLHMNEEAPADQSEVQLDLSGEDLQSNFHKMVDKACAGKISLSLSQTAEDSVDLQ